MSYDISVALGGTLANSTTLEADGIIASTSEAQAGTSDRKLMTPLKTLQAIEQLAFVPADIASTAEAQAGADNTKVMTPLRVSEAIDTQAVQAIGAVTTNRLTKTNATDGTTIQQTGITVDGSNNVSGIAGLTATGGGSLTGTWSNMGTVTTIDINGGTIDGTPIGGAAASTGAFTTLSTSGAISGTNTTTGTYCTYRNDDGGNIGIQTDYYHNSPSPAVNDVFANLIYSINSSTAVKRAGYQVLCGIDDPTNASEDTNAQFYIFIAGTQTQVFKLTSSVEVKRPLDISAAAAGQIIFPASQNASAGANTFDDYEEATFTPGVAFGGSATGVTYSTQVGRYTKVGNRVLIEGQLALSSNGTGTGNNTITGLPFTVAGSAAMQVTAMSGFSGLTAGETGLFLVSSTTAQLYHPTTTGSTVSTETNVTDTASFYFAGHYSV